MNPFLQRALLRAGGGLFRTLWRIARQVFHEATGAFFVLFSVVGAAGAWREWKKDGAAWLVAVAMGFSLMMAAFAVAAFRSARRVR